MAETTILQDVIKGIQRTPGNIAGGPVDLVNLVMGAVSGKGFDGFDAKPVGGSEWINEKFGLGSGGGVPSLAQASTEIAAGLVNPATATKSMIIGLPIAMRTGKAMDTFAEMERAGKPAHEIFKETNIFAGSKDGLLRTTLSDANARVNINAFEKHDGLYYVKHGAKLGDVLDHPELYKEYPHFKDFPVDILAGGKPGEASFTPATRELKFAGISDVVELKKTILHEVQHGVQRSERFTGGSSVPTELGEEGVRKVNALESLLKSGKFGKPGEETIKARIAAIKGNAMQKYKANAGEQEASLAELTSAYSKDYLDEVIQQMLSEGRDPQNWRFTDAKVK